MKSSTRCLDELNSVSYDRNPALHSTTNATEAVPSFERNRIGPAIDPTVELARCFLRLANLPNFALDRLSRYEATLWRQVGQIILALDALDRRNHKNEVGDIVLSRAPKVTIVEYRAAEHGQVWELLDILVWAAAFDGFRLRSTWTSYSWSSSALMAES